MFGAALDYVKQFTPGDLAFLACAAVTLLSGLGVVTQRRIVNAALLMLPCFAGIAGLYLCLGAEFLFAIQILIYAGAIMVLILFAILLLQRAIGVTILQYSRQMLPGVGIFFAVVALLGYVFLRLPWDAGEPGELPIPVAVAVEHADTNTARIGALFLTQYLLPFEVASLVLTVAMIGAIIMAKRWPHEPEEVSE